MSITQRASEGVWEGVVSIRAATVRERFSATGTDRFVTGAARKLKSQRRSGYTVVRLNICERAGLLDVDMQWPESLTTGNAGAVESGPRHCCLPGAPGLDAMARKAAEARGLRTRDPSYALC